MIFSLLKCVFLFGLITFSSPYANARPVVIDIDAMSNNHTQIGTFIGKKAQSVFPNIAEHYDNYLAFLLSPSQFKQLIPQIESLKAAIDSDYRAEIEAISSVWQLNTLDNLGDGKLSVNEFWLLQFLPDLTGINKGSAFAATNRSNKNPIAARNLDWKSTSDLRALQTISIYHYEDRTLVAVGFAGLVGIINGFNDQGLFVSLLDAAEQQLSTALAPINSTVFDLRTVLQNTDKITSASQVLAQKFYPRSHQILFADQENVAVLEHPSDAIGLLRKTDSVTVNEMPWNHGELLIIVGCFVLKNSPHNCHSSSDFYHWGRLTLLSKAFSESNVSVNDALTLMHDTANINQAIFNKNTLQSIVFTPKNKTLYLYTQDTKSVLENATESPLIEKYQFIQTNATAKDKLIDVGFLLLGVGVLAAAWWYIFRGNNRNASPLSK